MSELIERLPLGLARYRPRQVYFLLDEQVTDAIAGDNLASDIIAQESWPSADAFETIVAGLRLRLGAEENRELRRALAVWRRRLVLPELIGAEELPPLEEREEIESMPAEKRLTWPERWKQEALQEGMTKGREEGRQEGEHEAAVRILSRQLARRFGDAAAAEARASLQSADIDQILAGSERLLTAESVEDVLR